MEKESYRKRINKSQRLNIWQSIERLTINPSKGKKKRKPKEKENIRFKNLALQRKGKEKNRIPLFLNLHLIRRLAGKNFIKKISLSLRFRNIRKNEMKRLKKLITKKKNPRLLINQ